ncbi:MULTISPECIES: hypothetical protein [Saliphagus]|uniref:ArCOG06342 family protein n=1 Tax=Saliphagus infecundisoli TaxID=1849069 RepID=A0ABD5QKS3_9EURY|nr:MULTISPECIES: hypothetical protein [Saliphagus]
MTNDPLTAVFDAQRTAVEQSRKLTHDTIEAQRASFDAAGEMLAASERLTEQNAELTTGAVGAYFDALEAAFPEGAVDTDELRAVVEEGVETASESQLESLAAMADMVEESGAAYDGVADTYAEAVDSSFDAYLDAHENVEESVSGMADAVEDAGEEFDASA